MSAQCSYWSKAGSDSSTNDESDNDSSTSSAGNVDSDSEPSKQLYSLNLGDSTTQSVLVGDGASLINEERVKGSNKDYDYVKTYSSLLEAQEGVKSKEVCEQSWTRGMKYETKAGDKICYTCGGYPKCPKRMVMFLDPESQDVHVHVSTEVHNHIISSAKHR